MLDPRSAAKLNLMFIAFAFAVAPVAFGSAAGCALAGHRLISYWWLALTLGWAVVPSAIFARANRYQRQVRAAQLRDGRAARPLHDGRWPFYVRHRRAQRSLSDTPSTSRVAEP
jgi:hypothetical protein